MQNLNVNFSWILWGCLIPQIEWKKWHQFMQKWTNERVGTRARALAQIQKVSMATVLVQLRLKAAVPNCELYHRGKTKMEHWDIWLVGTHACQYEKHHRAYGQVLIQLSLWRRLCQAGVSGIDWLILHFIPY